MKIRKIWKYYRPFAAEFKWSIIATLFAYGVALLLVDLYVPLIYKNIIDMISNNSANAALLDELVRAVLSLGAVILIYNVFFRAGDYFMVYSQSNILKSLADDAYKRLHKHSYEFFADNFTGSLVTKVKRFVNSFETLHDNVVFSAWFDFVKLSVTVGVLTYFAPGLTLIFIGWLVLYVSILIPFLKVQWRKDLKRAEAESKTTSALADTVINAVSIKMFAAFAREMRNFMRATGFEKKRRDSAWYFQNLQNATQGLLIGLFEFVMIFAAIKLWAAGTISAGTIVLVQIYVFKAFDTVWNISRKIRNVVRALADAYEMVEIFEKDLDVKDPAEPESLRIKRGEIHIKNISFSYKKGERIFDGLTLKIAAGERVGLVGRSGSGKSTITKLLLRFADLEEGEILIDNQNISRIKQDDLRRSIAYVPQEPMLFHRSIKENIAYSKEGASIEEIINVSKKAHAHDFIVRLPQGYDTLVGERGVKLSGGERQRIAIARAMLKDAPIIVLDEATSALDSVSEKHVQAAIEELTRGKTTIVVAHRLSTVKDMDRIIVFEKGKIVEEGSHEELLAKRGLYFDYWQRQVI